MAFAILAVELVARAGATNWSVAPEVTAVGRLLLIETADWELAGSGDRPLAPDLTWDLVLVAMV